jgi:phage baseplate assembly protein W
LAQKKGVDSIKADLLQLLLTKPGERVMLPDFGTPLNRLIFDPNDAILKDAAKTMIINSINKWEPRIIIDNINVSLASMEDLNPNDPGDDLEAIMKISIKFIDPENISEVNELRLSIPLGGT